MLKIRIVPCLLLKGQGLVKTIKFKNPTYIGDPINAIKIFNDKEVDELVFLDITATREKRKPNFKLLSEIASECFMPLGYGGGINSLEDIEQLFNIGIEKVIINTAAFSNLNLITEAAKVFGSQSIVASVDVKKTWWRKKHTVLIRSGKEDTGINPVEYAKRMENAGAGEIILNSIDLDGTMRGYDLPLIKNISKEVSIPIIALGGAGSIQDFGYAVKAGASAVAAGSFFVFQMPHRAVLITYPTQQEIDSVF